MRGGGGGGGIAMLNQSIHRMPPVDTIIKEVYGLTVLYRHIYAVKGTILSHFSRPKVNYKNNSQGQQTGCCYSIMYSTSNPFSIVSLQSSQQ